jgi:hypothetical protein
VGISAFKHLVDLMTPDALKAKAKEYSDNIKSMHNKIGEQLTRPIPTFLMSAVYHNRWLNARKGQPHKLSLLSLLTAVNVSESGAEDVLEDAAIIKYADKTGYTVVGDGKANADMVKELSAINGVKCADGCEPGLDQSVGLMLSILDPAVVQPFFQHLIAETIQTGLEHLLDSAVSNTHMRKDEWRKEYAGMARKTIDNHIKDMMSKTKLVRAKISK